MLGLNDTWDTFSGTGKLAVPPSRPRAFVFILLLVLHQGWKEWQRLHELNRLKQSWFSSVPLQPMALNVNSFVLGVSDPWSFCRPLVSVVLRSLFGP